jgi:hypothetical protein
MVDKMSNAIIDLKNDPNINSKIGKRDIAFIGVAIILFLIFLFNFLQSSDFKSYGDIYIPFALSSLIFAGLAIVSIKGNKKLFGYTVFNGDDSNKISKFILPLIAGIAVAAISYYFSGSLGSIFNFKSLLPASVTPITSAGLAGTLAGISTLLVLGFLGAEQEEFTFGSVLPQTLATFFKGGIEVPIMSAIGGLIFLLFYPFLIAAIILFAITGLYIVFPSFRRLFETKEITAYLIVALVIGLLFGLYHIYSYGSTSNFPQILLQLAIFRIIAYFGNSGFKNTLFGRGLHYTNNSLIGASILGLPIEAGIFVMGIGFLVLFIVWRFGNGQK